MPVHPRQTRPLARDSLPGTGLPVAAARWSHDDKTAPCRTPVTHSHAALAFYTGGRSRVEQNGEWNLGEGDVLLVPAGEPHRMLERRGAAYWGLAFCVPCFAADSAASLLVPFERVRDGASAVVHIPSARHEYLQGLFRELEDIGGAGRPAIAPAPRPAIAPAPRPAIAPAPRGPSEALHAIQGSLLTLILAEVDRATASSEPVRATSGNRSRATGGGVVADALRFIERNCLGRLTLKDVAAAIGRSPTYVTAALTQATGRSAGDWITSGRMAEARRLLLHSGERVDIVAERVGYADATHFIRMFRREHGATPAAWRAARIRALGAPP